MDAGLKKYTIYEVWNENTHDIGAYLKQNGFRYSIRSTGLVKEIPLQLTVNASMKLWVLYTTNIPEETATYLALTLPGVAVKEDK